MSATYAVYQRQLNGTLLRLGVFRGPTGSVRSVTAAFVARCPHADLSTIMFARRLRMMGRYEDGPRVQADLEALA